MKYLLAFIFISHCEICLGQGMASIEYTIKFDTIYKFFKDGKANVLYEQQKEAEGAKVYLYFDKGRCHFPDYSTQTVSKNIKSQLIIAGLFENYVNLTDKMVTYPEQLGSSKYNVKRPLSNISYTVTDTVEMIGKYKCIKAYVKSENRSYPVWFTPEIPVPYGPGIYFGLPGLVLKAKMPRWVTIYATKVDLNSAYDKSILEIPKLEEMEYDEYYKIITERVRKWRLQGTKSSGN